MNDFILLILLILSGWGLLLIPSYRKLWWRIWEFPEDIYRKLEWSNSTIGKVGFMLVMMFGGMPLWFISLVALLVWPTYIIAWIIGKI